MLELGGKAAISPPNNLTLSHFSVVVSTYMYRMNARACIIEVLVQLQLAWFVAVINLSDSLISFGESVCNIV